MKIMKTLNEYEVPLKQVKKKKNGLNTTNHSQSENMLILNIKSMDHNFLDKKVSFSYKLDLKYLNIY